jgi:hypothetical protein
MKSSHRLSSFFLCLNKLTIFVVVKQTFIQATKLFLLVIVCSKMLLCFSLDSFSNRSPFSFFDQATEFEVDGEEKADLEPEDEYFVHIMMIHSDRTLKANNILHGHSSQLTEGLVFEIVPPPPKA